MQTFTSDALRIVNHRPLTSPSDEPHDLDVITPSSFLGKSLAPNTPLSAFHDLGVFLFSCQLAHLNFNVFLILIGWVDNSAGKVLAVRL